MLVAAVVVARFADRLGAPALLLFLALGMLLGEDGPGGIRFDDAHLTESVGVVALAVILFEGGLTADVRELRHVARAAALLATVGVVVTGLVVAAAAVVVLDLDLREGLLLGAVVSSTDAAAVFSALRGVPIPRRLRATLEGESGLNDPIAALATIALVEVLTHPGFDVADGLLLLARQVLIGVAGGLAAGALARAAIERAAFASAGLYPVAALAGALACFGVVVELGGSGLLAVYLLGLILGAAHLPHAAVTEGFHAGLAWLAQIALFVLLGLLVTPTRLGEDGLRPFVIALVLVVVARPLAVLASLVRAGFPLREQAFLAWAGLRGGVPIVFATFPIVEGVDVGRRLFDVVFYVVVVSVVVQGAGLRPAARLLGLGADEPGLRPAELGSATLRSLGAELVEVDVGRLGIDDGRALRDVRLPGGAVVAAIRRGGEIVPPRGGTELLASDRLYLLVRRRRLVEVERALAVLDARRLGQPAVERT